MFAAARRVSRSLRLAACLSTILALRTGALSIVRSFGRRQLMEQFVSSSTRKIGIIGVGFGAQVHVPGFRSEGWEVAAICSRNREKAQQAAADAGIDAVYTDPLELIRRDDLTAVSIIAPPGAHHALAIAALKAGNHVLCEK